MLNILRRIVQEVSAAPGLVAALNLMVQRVKETIEAEACSIFLYDMRQKDYVLMATDGLNPNSVGRVRVGLNDSLVGLVAAREEPINLDNAQMHPKFFPVPDVGEDNFKAFLGVPIMHQRQVLGVLIVQQEVARKFDEAEEAFLITLSAQLAGVIALAEATGVMTHLAAGHYQAHDDATLQGVPGAPGIAIGVAVVIYPLADLDAVPDRKIDDITAEIELFNAALNAAREDIRLLGQRLRPNLPDSEQALFDVYLRILDNSSIGREVVELVKQGHWAQGALTRIIRKHVQQFEQMEDSYLKERAADIQDLGRRVLLHLQSNQLTQHIYPENTILVGEDISASMLADVPDGHLIGVVSGSGSSNSHVAILARALAVPTVMGVGSINVAQLDNRTIIIDGYQGQIFVSPSTSLLSEFQELVEEEKELDADLAEMRDLPAQTLDGFKVSLCVNTGLQADISPSLSVGAEGVGLYRSEIPFMIRDRFPSENEQTAIYHQLLASFAPRPVIMRTLDVGGDKALSYLPIVEDNPFLGWRGIRISLDHPEIFLVQVRAMLLASKDLNNLRILLPMITVVNEVDEALKLIEQAYSEVIDDGHAIQKPPIGVMIEVPSAVYLARQLAQRVDFLSVGTNDLTQYLLAVDRNNPRVANLYNALHPAVIRALMYIVESAHKEGKVAGVCGEMAGDPASAILLLAMGFDNLSMSSSRLLRIKWVIRKFTAQRAKELLEEILHLQDATMIRAHLENVLETMGLGSLVRGGRK